MKFFRFIKRSFIDTFKTRSLYKFYVLSGNNKKTNEKKTVVSMIDGRLKHGGLSDRLCGIISAFQYCLLNNVDFKIYFVYPYQLNLFLEPNEYDWSIDSEELSYFRDEARPLYISQFWHEVNDMRLYANSKLNKNIKQIHLYSNMQYFYNDEFGGLFKKLFKKSKLLDDALNVNLQAINGPYVSLTFRFQQLLGDFRETGFPTIKSESERKELLNRCLNLVKFVHEKEKKKLVVTSDSNSFLKLVKEKFDFVYVIPGAVLHMDYVKQNEKIDISSHLKSFVDFFVLANAETIYLGNIKPLYGSSFPKTASMINNHKYIELTDKEDRLKKVSKEKNNEMIFVKDF